MANTFAVLLLTTNSELKKASTIFDGVPRVLVDTGD